MPNLNRREFVLAATSGLAALGLAACGGTSSQSASSSSDAAASKKLSVAATPSPHAEILNDFAKPLLAKEGIELEVREFTDYVQPNEVVNSGEIDCNYFQHINYLNNFNEEKGYKLVSVAKIHYEPFGIYAGKSSDLKSIADGAVIAVPNDPTNEARALLLLQQEGLITLKAGADISATPNDIESNPHNIEFREVEAAATPRALADVDFAAINLNYALEANLHVADALAVEAADGAAVDQYANIICTAAGKKDDERIAALVKVLTSDDFKAYLEKNYDKDVLPAF